VIRKEVDVIIHGLKDGRPIQHLTGRAWFFERWYKVNPSVLIPRPETEELVQWILSSHSDHELNLLDIGTGSGIIPISIGSQRKGWNLFGCDISKEALTIASENSKSLHNFKKISFYKDDILNSIKKFEEELDIIVSNPPYVLESETSTIQHIVLKHEPHLALFVPDNNPLLFYHHIVVYARVNLRQGGSIYFEVHKDYGREVASLMGNHQFDLIEIKKDIHGMDRMVRGIKR